MPKTSIKGQIVCRESDLWEGCTLKSLAVPLEQMPGWVTLDIPCRLFEGDTMPTPQQIHMPRDDLVLALAYLHTKGETEQVDPKLKCDLLPLEWVWCIRQHKTPLDRHYALFRYRSIEKDDPEDAACRKLFPLATRSIISAPFAIFHYHAEIDYYVDVSPNAWQEYMALQQKYGNAWDSTVQAREYSRAKERSKELVTGLADSTGASAPSPTGN